MSKLDSATAPSAAEGEAARSSGPEVSKGDDPSAAGTGNGSLEEIGRASGSRGAPSSVSGATAEPSAERTGIERQPPSIAAIKELRESLLAPVLKSRHKR